VGRLRWEGDIPQGSAVKIETRSGNTSTPDSTWTEWASLPALGHEAPIGKERARFLQIRATLTAGGAGSPTLDTLSAAYLQRNLRPQVQSVTVHPPGEVFQKPLSLTGETEILGLEGSLPVESRPTPSPQAAGGSSGRLSAPPAATSNSRKTYQKGLQTFSWKAEDQNGDTLTHEVHYRAVSDERFRLLRKGMTDAVLAWDTSTVPNGRYVIRVTTSDSPGNPEGLALTGEKESVPFDVDNTPPVVTATATGGRVRVVVKDDSSLVRRGRILCGRRALARRASARRHQRCHRGGLRDPAPRPGRSGPPHGDRARVRPPGQRRYGARRDPLKILVLRAGALGDLLLLRGVLASLRSAGHEPVLMAPAGPGAALVGGGLANVAEVVA
jgi:hypothetical protein